MSDLIKRLRTEAGIQGPRSWILDEAADEIDKLKESLARAVFEAEGWKDDATGGTLNGEDWHIRAKELLGSQYVSYAADPLHFRKETFSHISEENIAASEVTREAMKILAEEAKRLGRGKPASDGEFRFVEVK